jgi:hypothetical protein
LLPETGVFARRIHDKRRVAAGDTVNGLSMGEGDGTLLAQPRGRYACAAWIGCVGVLLRRFQASRRQRRQLLPDLFDKGGLIGCVGIGRAGIGGTGTGRVVILGRIVPGDQMFGLCLLL